jgi:tetratricopeptide (TPR) repeat protein
VALARIALASGRPDEFDQHLEKLEAQAPQNPDVLLLRAAFANRNGDTATAVKLAEQAFTAAPSTAMLLTLASHKEAAGNLEGAFQLYRSWIDKTPQDGPVTMAIANSLQRAQRSEEASVYFAEVLRLDRDNVVALNNLAWHIREENPEQALEYARRANDLSLDSPDVLDTLAVVEYSNEDYKRAQRSIERALSGSPNDPSLQYHSAMIAIATLEGLLDGGEEFAEIEQARALLAELGK